MSTERQGRDVTRGVPRSWDKGLARPTQVAERTLQTQRQVLGDRRARNPHPVARYTPMELMKNQNRKQCYLYANAKTSSRERYPLLLALFSR